MVVELDVHGDGVGVDVLFPPLLPIDGVRVAGAGADPDALGAKAPACQPPLLGPRLPLPLLALLVTALQQLLEIDHEPRSGLDDQSSRAVAQRLKLGLRRRRVEVLLLRADDVLVGLGVGLQHVSSPVDQVAVLVEVVEVEVHHHVFGGTVLLRSMLLVLVAHVSVILLLLGALVRLPAGRLDELQALVPGDDLHVLGKAAGSATKVEEHVGRRLLLVIAAALALLLLLSRLGSDPLEVIVRVLIFVLA
mmetsp:Transcript_14220/g.53404  ORF Transcript_14220/g.53404 Transcript_14220/m.53404 type:complete len:249 (+) Transcript_14220:6372-7118(+)